MASNVLDNVSLGTSLLPLSALKIVLDPGVTPNRGRSGLTRAQLDAALRVEMPDGRVLKTSPRMWSSFTDTVNQDRRVFDIYSYSEVFQRISDTKKGTYAFNYEVDPTDSGKGTLISMTNPNRPRLPISQVQGLISKFGGTNVQYQNGVVGAEFSAAFPMKMKIGQKRDSDFSTGHNMEIPLDGYGSPATYLMLIRLVCTNGAVARTKAFRTQFSMGTSDSDLGVVMDRALETFNQEEGYHAITSRVTAASQSWASLNNLYTLEKAINRGAACEQMPLLEKSKIQKMLHNMCGNPYNTYNIMAGSEPSQSRMRHLPVDCTVYDLINFGTEVRTHHFKSLAARAALNGWFGELITKEYDMENSCHKMPHFADFFLGAPRLPTTQAPNSI